MILVLCFNEINRSLNKHGHCEKSTLDYIPYCARDLSWLGNTYVNSDALTVCQIAK